MELSKYVACICEGTAEEVIMEILLDNDRLIFDRSQLLEETLIRCRDAKKFGVINVITAPEIEMLVIFAEKKYAAFKNSRKRPSDFCTQDLGLGNVKSRDFVQQYFQDVDLLIAAIKEYKRISHRAKGEYALANLLK